MSSVSDIKLIRTDFVKKKFIDNHNAIYKIGIIFKNKKAQANPILIHTKMDER